MNGKIAVAGLLLRVVGQALFLVGAIAGVLLAVGGVRVGGDVIRESTSSLEELIGATLLLVAFVVLGSGTLVVTMRFGHSLVLRGRRLSAKVEAQRNLQETSTDTRAPVLYFRPFEEDQVTSTTPITVQVSGVAVPSLHTEEEGLAKALEGLGPFIAIGKPGENLPQLGATRLYTENETWHSVVTNLMSRAQLVVMRLGDGPGFWWEVEQAIRIVSPERLVFLLPRGKVLFGPIWRRLQEHVPRISQVTPNLVEEQTAVTLAEILYFEPDWTPHLVVLKHEELWASQSEPLAPMLKIAFRPVFEQLDLEWTPPPVSRLIVRNIRFAIGGLVLTFLTFLYVGLPHLFCDPNDIQYCEQYYAYDYATLLLIFVPMWAVFLYSLRYYRKKALAARKRFEHK